MEILSLEVQRRTEVGKGAVRRLRRAGLVPGVVYGIRPSTPLSVNSKALEKLLGTRAGTNVVFQLDVAEEKKSERPVIVKELQRDSIHGDILHADFLEIRMDRRIGVSVPIVTKGEAPGVKLGGTLSQLMRELEVECLPNAIPEEISLDISGVDMSDVIHVRDLTLPEGVDLVSDLDDPVLTVVAPVEEEEEVEAEVEVAEAEAAPPAEGDQPAAPSPEAEK